MIRTSRVAIRRERLDHQAQKQRRPVYDMRRLRRDLVTKPERIGMNQRKTGRPRCMEKRNDQARRGYLRPTGARRPRKQGKIWCGTFHRRVLARSVWLWVRDWYHLYIADSSRCVHRKALDCSTMVEHRRQQSVEAVSVCINTNCEATDESQSQILPSPRWIFFNIRIGMLLLRSHRRASLGPNIERKNGKNRRRHRQRLPISFSQTDRCCKKLEPMTIQTSPNTDKRKNL